MGGIGFMLELDSKHDKFNKITSSKGLSEEDKWRISYLSKLLGQRQVFQYETNDVEENRLTPLIDSLCVN